MQKIISITLLLLLLTVPMITLSMDIENCESQCEAQFQQCQKDAGSLLLGGFVKGSARQKCENIKEECLKKCPKKQVHVHGKNCKHGHAHVPHGH